MLYPTVGGGPLYAYGTSSMAHPQLEAAGFEPGDDVEISGTVFELDPG